MRRSGYGRTRDNSPCLGPLSWSSDSRQSGCSAGNENEGVTTVTTISRLDAWERRLDLGIRFVPYVALAVSVVLAVATRPYLPSPPLTGTLLIAGLAAAWIFWMVTLHPA